MDYSVLWILLLQTVLAWCDTVLKIRVDQFSDNGKDWNGDNCDPIGYHEWQCDHVFTFCLGNSLSPDSDTSSCQYGSRTTAAFHNRRITLFESVIPDQHKQPFDNPLTWNFPSGVWQGSAKFKVLVMDHDWESDDLVDKLSLTIRDQSRTWRSVEMRGLRTYTAKTTLLIHYQLYCTDTYYGQRCDVRCFEADSSSTCPASQGTADQCCQNGGSCVPNLTPTTTVACRCPPGYTGTSCEVKLSICQFANPCQNGGSCFMNGTAEGGAEEEEAMCECAAGFMGALCEHVMPCFSQPCGAHGSCLEEKTTTGFGYTCECQPDYTGQDCDMHICNSTETNPCVNGTCSFVTDDGVRCACDAGFAGVHCEQKATYCVGGADDPCGGHGACVETVKGFRCQCWAGYSGERCERDPCQSSPCQEQGVCQPTATGFRCLCKAGYMGSLCQLECERADCLPEAEAADGQLIVANVPAETVNVPAKQSQDVVLGAAVGCTLLVILAAALIVAVFLVRKYRRKARQSGQPFENSLYFTNEAAAGHASTHQDPSEVQGAMARTSLPPTPYPEDEKKINLGYDNAEFTAYEEVCVKGANSGYPGHCVENDYMNMSEKGCAGGEAPPLPQRAENLYTVTDENPYTDMKVVV